MRLTPAEKINAAFLVALGLVTLIGIASVTSIQRFADTSSDLSSTHAALTELHSALANLMEAESGQRGFIITGDERHLSTYADATATILRQVSRLRTQTSEDPDQQQRLAQLSSLISTRLRLMTSVIDTRRAGGEVAAGQLVATGGGTEVMDSIRVVAAGFERTELDRLARRTARARARARMAVGIIGGGSLFAFLVVLGSGLVIRRDMTERRRAEHALRESETLLSQFMENLPIGVMVIDEAWQPRFANNAAVEILGPSVLIDNGGPPLELLTASADVYPEKQRPLNRALAGETCSVDDAAVRVDGRLIPLQVSAAPIYDASGRIAYAIAAFDDITARRDDEVALRDAVESAEAASRTKSDFLARMSHELRTPLNSVIGFATILLKNKAGNQRDQDLAYLERILENGKHLLLLINDILDLSKIEAGKVEIEQDTTDLNELVASVTAQFDMHENRDTVPVITDLPDRVDSVVTDPARLRQILINLVGNAVKFTERGSVTVSVDVKPGTRTAVAIRVADTGIGIPADRLEAIFDAFEQAESSTTRKYGGTGLGLPISRALCELLGYRLRVGSRVGEGTVFTVDMRPGEARPDAAPRELGPGADVPASDATVRGRSGERLVLVVDDEPDSRILLTHYVEEFGCRAVTTYSATSALMLARELKPDLITVDLMMPELNGWQLLRGLKDDPELADIPVVIVSVVAEESRASLLGALELLQKPVDRSELFSVLRRVVGNARARILIIDDEADARHVLQDMLEDHASAVRSARNGQEALAVLRNFEPDLVITDLVMPVMDGMTFLEIFRSTPRFQHVPVIVVSGKDISMDERDRLGRHASAVLSKGNALETDLRRVIGGILGVRATVGSDGSSSSSSSDTGPSGGAAV